MLELIVEADVVHLLEHVVPVRLDRDWTAAPTADERVGHERIVPARELLCKRSSSRRVAVLGLRFGFAWLRIASSGDGCRGSGLA